MFQNCLTYNPPGSDVTIVAKIVQKFFNERVDRMNQLERTKIETMIEPKVIKIAPKKSRGWQKGRPRKSKKNEFECSVREKWPEHMFTAKVRYIRTRLNFSRTSPDIFGIPVKGYFKKTGLQRNYWS